MVLEPGEIGGGRPAVHIGGLTGWSKKGYGGAEVSHSGERGACEGLKREEHLSTCLSDSQELQGGEAEQGLGTVHAVGRSWREHQVLHRCFHCDGAQLLLCAIDTIASQVAPTLCFCFPATQLCSTSGTQRNSTQAVPSDQFRIRRASPRILYCRI